MHSEFPQQHGGDPSFSVSVLAPRSLSLSHVWCIKLLSAILFTGHSGLCSSGLSCPLKTVFAVALASSPPVLVHSYIVLG